MDSCPLQQLVFIVEKFQDLRSNMRDIYLPVSLAMRVGTSADNCDGMLPRVWPI